MLLSQHGRIASTALRNGVPGVSRVFIARTDGIAFYDDVALASRDAAAAASSSLLGLDKTVAHVLSLGPVASTVVYGADSLFVLAPLDAMHLLGVVADSTCDAAAVLAAMNQVAATLGASHQQEVEARRGQEERLRAAQVDVEGEMGKALHRESQLVGASWRDRWNVA